MILTAIDIERKLAVVNGFVEIPDGQRTLRTKLTPEDVLALIPGTRRVRIGLAPARIHDQEWIVFPTYDRFADAQPPADWFQILRDAAEAA